MWRHLPSGLTREQISSCRRRGTRWATRPSFACDTFYFVFFCLEQSTEKEDDFNGCRCSYFTNYYHRHCARSQKLDVSCNFLIWIYPFLHLKSSLLQSALSGFKNDYEILTEAKYFQNMARKKKLYLASILVGVLVALGLIVWLSHWPVTTSDYWGQTVLYIPDSVVIIQWHTGGERGQCVH